MKKNCYEGQKGYVSRTNDCPIKPNDINHTDKNEG